MPSMTLKQKEAISDNLQKEINCLVCDMVDKYGKNGQHTIQVLVKKAQNGEDNIRTVQ